MNRLHGLILSLGLLAAALTVVPAHGQTPCPTDDANGQALPGACATLPSQGLSVQDTAVIQRQDAYGRDVPVLTGNLVNSGTQAYSDISLTATAFDDQENDVGEGIGYLVNACGAGLLPDYALQPGDSQRFEIQLEMSDPEAQILHTEVEPDGTPVEASESTDVPLVDGFTEVTDQEVVDVEWIDGVSLRYGVGCDHSVFTGLNWYQLNVLSNTTEPITHPHAGDVTDALRQRLKLTDDTVFAKSALTFSPQGDRLVYQGDRNQFNTAEQNGSYARTIYNDLYNRTLQGILWLPDSRFLAYYFGAYGDPVYYFTATEQGQPISLPPAQSLPSDIVPGASPDGRQAVIAGTFFENSGYYLKSLVSNNDPDLLFEGDPAGNNYPAPLFLADPGDNPHNRIYIARPIDDVAQMQCYNLTEQKLYDLGPLPIQISTDERAWWWLSPDNQRVALAANGVHSGLWTIALANLPGCGI